MCSILEQSIEKCEKMVYFIIFCEIQDLSQLHTFAQSQEKSSNISKKRKFSHQKAIYTLASPIRPPTRLTGPGRRYKIVGLWNMSFTPIFALHGQLMAKLSTTLICWTLFYRVIFSVSRSADICFFLLLTARLPADLGAINNDYANFMQVLVSHNWPPLNGYLESAIFTGDEFCLIFTNFALARLWVEFCFCWWFFFWSSVCWTDLLSPSCSGDFFLLSSPPQGMSL